MIARIWRGVVLADKAKAYLEHQDRTGVAGFHETPGNRGAYVLHRTKAGRTEVLVISL